MSAKKKAAKSKKTAKKQKASKRKVVKKGAKAKVKTQKMVNKKPEMTPGQIAGAALLKMGEDPDDLPATLSTAEIDRRLAPILARKLKDSIKAATTKALQTTVAAPDFHPLVARLPEQSRAYLEEVAEGVAETPLPSENNLHDYDPVRQFFYIPTKFRVRVASLVLHNGIRFFGKAPMIEKPILDFMPDSTIWFSSGPPRPMCCPEPPPKGSEFVLAWENDGRWHVESPDSITIEGGNTRLTSIAARVLHDLDNASRQPSPDLLAFAGELAGILATKSIQGPFALATSSCAFALGAEFNERHAFPWRTGTEVHRVDSAVFTGWSGILHHALLRHQEPETGEWPGRENLLKALGCRNLNEFSKSSQKLVNFGQDLTPKIAFKTFYDSYGKQIKKLTETDLPKLNAGKRRLDKQRRSKERKLRERGKQAQDQERAAQAAKKVQGSPG